MKFLLFTKSLAQLSLSDLAGLGASLGVDGYDLCVREGHQVQPEDVQSTLPQAVDALGARSLVVGMVSLPPNLTDPDDPRTLAVCRAMRQSGVSLLKIGYFPFKPDKHDFADLLHAAVLKLAKWRDLAQAHNLTVCYHTHANYLGSSAGVLAHMLEDFDPAHVAAYLDPAQLILQGEGFPVGMAILKNRVAAIGLKDVLISRGASSNHGNMLPQWVQPGEGMVDWTAVSNAVVRSGYTGVISAHVGMHQTTSNARDEIAREVSFYRSFFKETPA